ncbi:beta-class carbonic anhydrase [Aspergillus mulundensis]|uniref:Carbonic anhydrase n=1 Tax=Aspergillus mulundensis TaxID=1810919 RepID=A0A3D8R510_9EURO|nr:Carbonic anhydrase [Aspergillus mulundensis]RDW69011.1 Carbonic anhydrase [Aspergillus mulundensis]
MSAAKEFDAANAKKVAVVACMDARLDPAQALGLEEGDAHVIRNTGGRASDALRSIIISQQLLGTREIVVVHRTDCGMLTFTDVAIRGKVRIELGQNADHIAFMPFSDLRQSVVEDIYALKESPLVLDVPFTGYMYEDKSGRIVRVE